MLNWRTCRLFFFFNLHVIYSPYYSPSVVFCSCCSALGAACWLGSSLMAVWAASSCSALGAALGWLCFPLAASLLPPRLPSLRASCWGSSFSLPLVLHFPPGACPCLCSRKSCWKVSAFQTQSLESLLHAGLQWSLAMLVTRGSCWWFYTKINQSVAAHAHLFTFKLIWCLEMKIIWRLLVWRLTKVVMVLWVLNLSRIILSKRGLCVVMGFFSGCVEHGAFSGCCRLGWFCSWGAGEWEFDRQPRGPAHWGQRSWAGSSICCLKSLCGGGECWDRMGCPGKWWGRNDLQVCLYSLPAVPGGCSCPVQGWISHLLTPPWGAGGDRSFSSCSWEPREAKSISAGKEYWLF